MVTIYYYIDDVIIRNRKSSYAVLKVTAKNEENARDRAVQFSVEQNFRLAGGSFGTDAIPGDFKSQYTVINLPKNYRLKKGIKKSIADVIIDYEMGLLSGDEITHLFQKLVNSGLAWKLEGHYGRLARKLLDMKMIKPPKKLTKYNAYDAYGNRISFR